MTMAACLYASLSHLCVSARVCVSVRVSVSVRVIVSVCVCYEPNNPYLALYIELFVFSVYSFFNSNLSGLLSKIPFHIHSLYIR